MSAINPHREEYETSDALKIAKDVSWVIKTLWSGAVVTILAAIWVAALAADVKVNAEKIDEAATKEQVQQVIESLKDIKGSLRDADDRQRNIQSQLDRVETEVENLKEEVDEQG